MAREKLIEAIVIVRETLESMLGDKFTSLPEEEKINIQIVMLYKLAEKDRMLMEIIANDAYEYLRNN